MGQSISNKIKPIVKWAGGKTQLLSEIIPLIPEYKGKYIEPFIGGGALFFALQPKNAVIADSNPELINMYVQVATNVDKVIDHLKKYENTEEMFLRVRSLDWTRLPAHEAAARTIYLNKTCFNGLYRVNRTGQFNTPFGKYKNPTICDEELLHNASIILKNTTIVCGDYLDVLKKYAKAGDFVFLDPPYVPVSKYSDFKRYTKEQFYNEDHKNLANEVSRLQQLGCYVIETNSDHPLVLELYKDFDVQIVDSKRAISSKAESRKGKDAIIKAFPINNTRLNQNKEKMPAQVSCYPTTRFMGSKNKLLADIWAVAKNFKFESVLDLFSGSGVVGYMFKCQGKRVITNDYMAMSAVFAKAMIENNTTILSDEEANKLILPNSKNDHFVENTFAGLYFSETDNILIDNIRSNLFEIEDEYKKSIGMSALIRACLKKRPRGIFTYTGDRYNDGRRDLSISLQQQFLEAVKAINGAVFTNRRKNLAINGDAMDVKGIKPDLVYIDPPYFTPLSDNEYVRRYHFVEGLARDWQGVEIQEHTKTKKFKSYPTPFSTKDGAYAAFNQLFKKYKNSILIVSYSSNSLPSQEEMISIMQKYKSNVEVVPIDYTYSFGNQSTARTHRNNVQEFLFVGF